MKFLKWLFRVKCNHQNIRCIHGDEIILAGWRRSACLDCPQLFDSLPQICTQTGKPHEFKKKKKK